MAGCLGGPIDKDGQCQCDGHRLVRKQGEEHDRQLRQLQEARDYDFRLLEGFIGAAFAGNAQSYRRDGVIQALRRLAR